MNEVEEQVEETPEQPKAPVISMEEYKKAQEESWVKDRKQAHIDVATSAIRKDKAIVTLILGEKGLEVYSNITGAPLHSLIAMASHTMLGAVPRSDFNVKV